MKKNIKIIVFIYLIVALFAYALSIRVERLESREDINNRNESIVLKIN